MRTPFVLSALLWSAAALRADVRPASVFTDNMVLQRNCEVALWGRAEPGETVTITPSWRGPETCRADTNGAWSVLLKTIDGTEPQTLTFSGSSSVTISNVLLGEVWLCSGQSNMEWAMGRHQVKNMAEEIPAARYPTIRLLKVPKRPLPEPGTAIESAWVECTPATVTNFSAVGYFFGRELRDLLGGDVPVGLIDASWGGTEIEQWIARSALAADPEFAEHLDPARAKAYDEARASVHKELGLPPPHLPQRKPSILFNGMIAPLIPLSLRGVLWYQGESNIYRSEQYARSFPLMIADWRKAWRAAAGAGALPDAEFPFLFVQIAPFSGYTNWPMPRSSAELREAQAATARSVPNVGMVVTTDLVDDLANIHPADKQSVGGRLARLAMARAYGVVGQLVESPEFQSLEIDGDAATVVFARVGDGLSVRGEKLVGFELAGADLAYKPAVATAGVDRVVVRAEGIEKPVAVRFAWDEAPQPNLFNSAGLPAVPFRTDKQPGLTADVKW